MVYESKSLMLCHEPTEAGRDEYQRLLEAEADAILFRAQHPFRWFWRKIAGFFLGE